MPSFDIVSKIDAQTLDNAINNAKKEILNRYDFNGSKSTVELDKKSNTITIVTEDDMRLKAIQDSIIGRMVKQSLDPKALDFGEEQYASGNMLRKEIKIKEGIDKEAVGEIAAKIRAVRPPEPYKGKGIKYEGERIIRKEGKAGKKK